MSGPVRPGQRIDSRFTVWQDLGEEDGVRHFRVTDAASGQAGRLRLAPEVRPGENDVVQERLRQEGSIALQTRAAGALPRLIASGEWEGRPFLVTEEWPETRLDGLVREGRGLAEPERLAPIAWQLAAGLEALHGLSQVHRLVHLGQVRVQVSGARTRAVWTGLRLIETETGRASWLRVRAGRLAFVAPELFAHDRARKLHGPAADRFAFGVLLYRLACGRWPVDRPESADYVLRLQVRGPAPLPAEAPLDARQRAIIMALLSGLPSRRPPLAEVRAAWSAGEGAVLPADASAPAPAPATAWPGGAEDPRRAVRSGDRPPEPPELAAPPPLAPAAPAPAAQPPEKPEGAGVVTPPAPLPPRLPPDPARRGPPRASPPRFPVDPAAPTLLPPEDSDTGPPSVCDSEDDFTPPPPRGQAHPHPGLALAPDGPYTHALHEPPPVWAPRVPRTPAPDLDPQPFGERFVPIDVVGVGTRAAVFRARDLREPREVALKIALSERAPLFGACGPLSRAAESAPSRNLLRILAHGVRQGRSWVALEFAAGPSLEKAVTRRGPCQPPVLAWLIEGVAQALESVHQATGHPHGNLTPGNVFLTGPGGAPRVAEPGPEPATGLVARGTDVLWRRLGVAAFAAPELLLGQPADRATDLYALAGLTYYLVSTRPPHDVSDPRELLDAKLDSAPRPPTALQVEGSHALWDLLLRALHPDRGRRPPDLSTYLMALRRACQPGGAP